MLMTAVAVLTVKLGYGMHGRKCAGMSDPNAKVIPMNNKMSLDFEHAWLDIYFMLEDNAFDSSRVFHSNDGSVWIGKSQFVEVPF
jgi:hypothetical protein